jgi:hypothetical protein
MGPGLLPTATGAQPFQLPDVFEPLGKAVEQAGGAMNEIGGAVEGWMKGITSPEAAETPAKPSATPETPATVPEKPTTMPEAPVPTQPQAKPQAPETAPWLGLHPAPTEAPTTQQPAPASQQPVPAQTPEGAASSSANPPVAKPEGNAQPVQLTQILHAPDHRRFIKQPARPPEAAPKPVHPSNIIFNFTAPPSNNGQVVSKLNDILKFLYSYKPEHRHSHPAHSHRPPWPSWKTLINALKDAGIISAPHGHHVHSYGGAWPQRYSPGGGNPLKTARILHENLRELFKVVAKMPGSPYRDSLLAQIQQTLKRFPPDIKPHQAKQRLAREQNKPQFGMFDVLSRLHLGRGILEPKPKPAGLQMMVR